MPQRFQRKRSKGWRMPPNTIYVGRLSKYGNPFHLNRDGSPMDPALAVESFRRRLAEYGGFIAPGQKLPTIIAMIQAELRGKDLACWCPLDQPCHADVLLELANSE